MKQLLTNIAHSLPDSISSRILPFNEQVKKKLERDPESFQRLEALIKAQGAIQVSDNGEPASLWFKEEEWWEKVNSGIVLDENGKLKDIVTFGFINIAGNSNITSLPNIKELGVVNLRGCKQLKALGVIESVYSLDISGSGITSIGNLENCVGIIYAQETSIRAQLEIVQGVQNGTIKVSHSVTGDGEGEIYLGGTEKDINGLFQVEDLSPFAITIKGNQHITSLQKTKRIAILDARGSALKDLGDLEEVSSSNGHTNSISKLDLSDTQVSSIGKLKRVPTLLIRNCGLELIDDIIVKVNNGQLKVNYIDVGTCPLFMLSYIQEQIGTKTKVTGNSDGDFETLISACKLKSITKISSHSREKDIKVVMDGFLRIFGPTQERADSIEIRKALFVLEKVYQVYLLSIQKYIEKNVHSVKTETLVSQLEGDRVLIQNLYIQILGERLAQEIFRKTEVYA